MIRKAVDVAAYTMSDAASFCDAIAPGMDPIALRPKLLEAADIMDKIFIKTETLFIYNKLENIP